MMWDMLPVSQNCTADGVCQHRANGLTLAPEVFDEIKGRVMVEGG